MPFGYKFSNLIGTVYRGGNLSFVSSTNAVVSPVGNKLTVFDLRNHRSETLSLETEQNIVAVDVSPLETAAIVADESGSAFYVSMVSKTILHRYHFNKKVEMIKFSPDGKFFAVCRDTDVLLFRAPGVDKLTYKPFFVEHTFKLAQDAVNWLDWNDDSKHFLVCSNDTQVRLCSVKKPYILFALSGHWHVPMFCSFSSAMGQAYTLDKSGLLIQWEWGVAQNEPTGEPETTVADALDDSQAELETNKQTKIYFRKLAKHHTFDLKAEKGVRVVSACMHKARNLLVTGLSNGSFMLHELPEFVLIQSLSVSEFPLNSVVISSSGDWIAVASARLGQLLVWEWLSETYVMKQQGHLHNITCASYSPNGALLASGGHDSKVKLWNVDSGFCFVTFNEHKGDVTGVCWTQAGRSVLSCSLDGTVRAFDLKRYRNFRTFVSPTPVQFHCVCVDSNGEIVCAGGKDVFNVYVWSLSSGRLLDILSGHQGPISALCFCPTECVLASSSWDCQIIIWDAFEGKGGREPLDCCSEVFDVKFHPNGSLLACCCVNNQILIFDWRSGTQVYTIEGKYDLETVRGEKEVTKAETSVLSKAFSTIAFSPDGECILAAGKSPFICLYHVAQQLLVKKFKVTNNQSIDCVDDHVDRKKLSEFGNLALIDSTEDDDQSVGKQIDIPGFRSNDPGVRSYKPEMLVSSVQFCPTGRSWVACTVEGLLMYSLDRRYTFEPFHLGLDIVPARVHDLLGQQEYCEALMTALKLNDVSLIAECMEKTPVKEIDCVCRTLPDQYAERTLNFIGDDQLASSVHVEFYLLWIRSLCLVHGLRWKLSMTQRKTAILKAYQSITMRQKMIGKICESNMYTLKYLLDMNKVQSLDDANEHTSLEQLMDVNEEDICN